MTDNGPSIRAELRQAERSRNITGHEEAGPERFDEDTRHMIVYDVLTVACPVGGKGERVRMFLSNAGYQAALQSHEQGEMKIIRHARVRRGELFFVAPEHDNEI